MRFENPEKMFSLGKRTNIFTPAENFPLKIGIPDEESNSNLVKTIAK